MDQQYLMIYYKYYLISKILIIKVLEKILEI